MAEFVAIRKNLYLHHFDILHNIQLGPVLDELRAKKALTTIQLEDIAICSKPTDKVSRCLQFLHEARDETLGVFVNSLRQSGQVPLQMLVSGRGKLMTVSHKESLETHRVSIADNLESTFLIAYLQQKEILTQYDKEMLNSEGIMSLKNRILLDILIKKCDLAYYHFVQGLRDVEPFHRYIANILEPPNHHKECQAQIAVLTQECNHQKDMMKHENNLLRKKLEEYNMGIMDEDRPRKAKKLTCNDQENPRQIRRRKHGCVTRPSLSSLEINSLENRD